MRADDSFASPPDPASRGTGPDAWGIHPEQLPHPATVTVSGSAMVTGVDADRIIGRKVTLRGGFEEGIVGTIVANEPTPARPYRYRVRVDGTGGNAGLSATIGGVHPIGLDLWRPLHLDDTKPCPYCGDGPCSGSARTARGHDLERWEAIHRPRS